jgi:N-acetylmuramoyl-L-alanine amidase
LLTRLFAAAAALGALVVAASAAQSPAPGAPYTVVAKSGRQPLAVRVVGGQEMFSLDDLARLFGFAVREDQLAGALTITANNQSIVLSPQQPLASVGGRMISLPASPVREGRTWLVPVDFVSRVLAPAINPRIELRKPSRLVLMGDVRMPRVAARSETLGNLARVTVDVAPATPHGVTQEGTRLLVRFDADALDGADLRAAPGDLVQAIHPGDAPSVLAIDLGPRAASFRAADQQAPTPTAGRIVIDVVPQAETPGPAPGQPQPPAQPAPEAPPLLDLGPPGGVHSIVIDPGHGGDDMGAKGAQGTQEKNVTLAVARRLKASLEARLGIRVVLTRDGDQAVPLDQRAAMANNNKADLFISLHANASVRPAVAGAQVFYLAPDADAAQRGGRSGAETLPVLGGGSRDIEVIPWATAQDRHVDQSAALARMVEAALREHVPMSARPLQQGPFRVLVGANMPAVLVEMGFLTNAGQEQQLTSDGFQAGVASALSDAIVRFRGGSAAGGAHP